VKLGWSDETLRTEDPMLRPGLYYGATRLRFWVWSDKDANTEKGLGEEEGVVKVKEP